MTTFNVMGFSTSQRDENTQSASLDEQTSEPALEIIYSTDVEDEAKQIVAQGGFVRDDVWYVARHYTADNDIMSPEQRDPEAAALAKGDVMLPHEEAGFRPLGGSTIVPPDNSTAEVDPVTGAVKTDRGKRPVEEEDITEMIEKDLESSEALKKRNIVD